MSQKKRRNGEKGDRSMKVYKVFYCSSAEEAEETMNEWARQGYEVVSTSYWAKFITGIMVTMAKENS
jgi:hypothetical protein